jgi:hypothetical protein
VKSRILRSNAKLCLLSQAKRIANEFAQLLGVKADLASFANVDAAKLRAAQVLVESMCVR